MERLSSEAPIEPPADSKVGETSKLSYTVGRAIKRQRQIANITMRKLAQMSDMSTAMISRIESGQVSPSLTTLEALADALSLSVVAFFADTVKASDVMFVKAGEGTPVTRNFPHHCHTYRILAQHRKDPLSFDAASVTIDQRDDNDHPKYITRGFVFVTVTKGSCTYLCGEQEFEMNPGDSISFDAELVHGVKHVVSYSVTCTMISAKIL